MTASAHLAPPPVAARGKPAGRLSLAFGRRFFLLLFIGLVWIGPAWSDLRYLYGMAIWDAAMLALWLVDLRRLPRPGQIELRRVWTAPLELSVPARVTIALRNTAGRTVTARVLDDVPPLLRHGLPEAEIVAARGGEAGAAYDVCPRQRGDLNVGDAFVRYRSAWQVAERWASFSLRQPVRVYPNLAQARRDIIYLIRSRQIALEKRHKHLPGRGREFQTLREYRQGDEWRDVCWTASARRARLITKVYQVERSQTLWLVLDAGRLLRASVLGLSKLDYAVNAALSLAQVALYSGDRVALLAYGRRIQQRLPAGHGPRHMRALLEALARTRGEDLEADHLRAAETLLTFQKRRSLVVWLTDVAETPATPEVVEGASLLARRHLVLFAVIGQPEMPALLAERPETGAGMYRYVAAQEIVHRRDLLLGALRRQGALTLEIDPRRLSSALVNQYLDAKDRSLI